jgi:prepilin-type N-terminal cleavage/methylation domain-containing protein
MKTFRTHPALRGFTLIELLVVIAIIAILAGLLLTAGGGVRNKMMKNRAQTELQQVALAINAYKSKLGYYPPDNRNNPARPPLYFELVGCRRVMNQNGSDVSQFVSLDRNIAATPFALNATFGTLGIQNASSSASSDDGPAAQTFIKDLKPTQYVILNGLPVLGVQLDGPANLMIGNINPFRYNSSNPTNNPTSFDLWVDVIVAGKTNRINNWGPIITL